MYSYILCLEDKLKDVFNLCPSCELIQTRSLNNLASSIVRARIGVVFTIPTTNKKTFNLIKCSSPQLAVLLYICLCLVQRIAGCGDPPKPIKQTKGGGYIDQYESDSNYYYIAKSSISYIFFNLLQTFHDGRLNSHLEI